MPSDCPSARASPSIRWISEHTLRVQFADSISDETSELVDALARALNAHGPIGTTEIVPAYATVTVSFTPEVLAGEGAAERMEREVRAHVEGSRRSRSAAPRDHLVTVPVCYDADLAPDLADVADHAGLAIAEVIAAHTGADYIARFLGFCPGFAYLAGLPSGLHVPRLASPRPRVPPGSVAIAGNQAGIYPFETPGGWRIIGRTPLTVFDSRRDPPCLIEPGDHVRFVAISRGQFDTQRERAIDD